MNFFDFVNDHKLPILIVSLIINLLLLITCLFLCFSLFNYECEECNCEILTSNNDLSINTQENYYVDVKGAVKNPGVYEVSSNNIINDVITMAGGFTKSAYTKNINLSKKVSNELVIYVYTKSEYEKLNTSEVVSTKECVCPTYDINECINNASSEIISSNDATSDSSVSTNTKEDNKSDNTTKLININTASAEELSTLSGIGESKAEAIIEYRNKTKFVTIEDIMNVSGIGEKAFEKIKDYITV